MLKRVSTRLISDKVESSKHFDCVSDVVQMIVSLYEAKKNRSREAFGRFELDSCGLLIKRLGQNIPSWLERLSCDTIGNYFDDRVKKRNFRLVLGELDLIEAYLRGYQAFFSNARFSKDNTFF